MLLNQEIDPIIGLRSNINLQPFDFQPKSGKIVAHHLLITVKTLNKSLILFFGKIGIHCSTYFNSSPNFSALWSILLDWTIGHENFHLFHWISLFLCLKSKMRGKYDINDYLRNIVNINEREKYIIAPIYF